MRTAPGAFRSSVLAIVMGVVVGTSVTVHQFRSSRHTSLTEQGVEYAMSPDVGPQEMIPGFSPARDIDKVQAMLKGMPATPKEAKIEPTAVPADPRPIVQVAASPAIPAPKSLAVEREYVAAHPKLSLRDLEDINAELLRLTENAKLPTEVADATKTRTVATYLFTDTSGPKLLVYTKDAHGLSCKTFTLTTKLEGRLEQKVAKGAPSIMLLFVRHFTCE